MQDRFKFRVAMFSDNDKFSEFQYIELGELIECTLCGYNKEPQQCTGFKDKNGMLIYEGDCFEPLRDEGEESRIVVYDENTASYKVACSGSADEWNGLYDEIQDFVEYENLEDFSSEAIIGNIHENKELLEVKND